MPSSPFDPWVDVGPLRRCISFFVVAALVAAVACYACYNTCDVRWISPTWGIGSVAKSHIIYVNVIAGDALGSPFTIHHRILLRT